jgi:uncharacterized repeat protein (TIGR01451 family)
LEGLVAAIAIVSLVVLGTAPSAVAAYSTAQQNAHLKSGFVAAKHVASKNGQLVGSLTFSVPCSSGLGVGITFDGTHLWYTCYGVGSAPDHPTGKAAVAKFDLLEANSHTGKVLHAYNLNMGLGALAYDSQRQGFWTGYGNGHDAGNVYFIHLAASGVPSIKLAFRMRPQDIATTIDDGIAYDGQTHLIYVKGDTSTTIHVYTPTGTWVKNFLWAGNACYNSGLAIGGDLLFEGSDGCSHIWVVNKKTLAHVFDFSTVNPGLLRDEGLGCDAATFRGKDVMWSKDAYKPAALAFLIPNKSCGSGGLPVSNAKISVSKTGKQQGRNVTFSINYGNTGSDTALHVSIADRIPDGTTLIHQDPGPCGKSFANRILHWCVGNLAAGSTGTLAYTLKLASSMHAGATIHNCTTAFYHSGTQAKSARACTDLAITGGKPHHKHFPRIEVKNTGSKVWVKPWPGAAPQYVGCGGVRFLHTAGGPALPWSLKLHRGGKHQVNFKATIVHRFGVYVIVVNKKASIFYGLKPIDTGPTVCRIKPHPGK